MARSAFFVALVSVLFQRVHSMSIVKRDSNNVPPGGQTLDMPLFFDSQGRYVLPVQMGSGSSLQTFNFTLSTGTGLTSVAASGCSDCSNTALYDQSKSPSAISLSGSDITTYFGSSFSGSLIKENCGAKLGNGSFWQYPNQTVVTISSQDQPILTDGISGIFGLGTNRPPAGQQSSSSIGFSDSVYGQWFPRNPGHENFTFGMMLEPPSSKPTGGSSAGIVHWLQPNPAFYKPDQISWVNADGTVSDTATNNGSTTTPAQDWTVGLDGWVATAGSTHLSNTHPVVATVDPMFPNIYLPADQAKIIHDAIKGSSPAPANFATLGSASQAFLIPCDTQYTFGLEAGSQTFVITPDTLIIQQDDGTCLSGIEGFTDTTQTSYLVGSRFISTIYLIFNIPRDGTPSLGLSPRVDPPHSTNVGPIIGGTVGGVAIVLILALTAYYYLRKRANRQRGPFEIIDVDKPVQHIVIEPYTLNQPTREQLVRPLPPTSPAASQPLLSDDEQLNIGAAPPPSYEEASSSSEVSVARGPPRNHKGRPRPQVASSPLSDSTPTVY